jgi:endonuclease/exonuclease/phosphatase family metal-dependent hydrolase
VLKVGTLNMNTGHGPRGEFRQLVGKRELEENLSRVADLLSAERLDVACLQEVDFHWRGTHDIHQAEWIARRAGYAHVHCVAHHTSVIPRPFDRLLSKKEIIFTRDCGTAILSRTPILHRQQYTFGQTLTAHPIVNHFAELLNESKGYSLVEISVGGRRIGIINVHLLNDIVYEIFRHLRRQVRGEIFARAWQVEKLLEHVRERNDAGMPMIVCGDFNSVPREDTLFHLHSRSGDPDDYRRDISMVLIREARLIETIPALFGQGSPEAIREFHTYPAVDPDRTLDYVFCTRELAVHSYRVAAEVVSDHRLVIAELAFRKNAAQVVPLVPKKGAA